MIPKTMIRKIRKLLNEAENPLYFFDDDCDGTTSFLQLYNEFGGKGLIMKEGKKLMAKYWDSVQTYNADVVVVLDIPGIDEEFMKSAQQNKIPLIWVDHHQIVEVTKNVIYLNPRIFDKEDSRSTSYWAAQITQDINWLALTGTITDYTFAEDYIKEFGKKRPDLIPPDVKDVPQAMNETKIGLLGSIINANVRGTVKEAMASVKTLTRIKNPEEILNQETPAGKYIYKKYAKYKKFYDKIKSQINITDKKLVFTSYHEDNNSVSSALSTEIASKNPDKVVVIARISKGEAYLSIRAQKMNILRIASDAIAGLGHCGGHENAIGASMPEKNIELFIKKLEEKIE